MHAIVVFQLSLPQDNLHDPKLLTFWEAVVHYDLPCNIRLGSSGVMWLFITAFPARYSRAALGSCGCFMLAISMQWFMMH
jgi:hypothetical protein